MFTWKAYFQLNSLVLKICIFSATFRIHGVGALSICRWQAWSCRRRCVRSRSQYVFILLCSECANISVAITLLTRHYLCVFLIGATGGYQYVKNIAVNGHPTVILSVAGVAAALPSIPCMSPVFSHVPVLHFSLLIGSELWQLTVLLMFVLFPLSFSWGTCHWSKRRTRRRSCIRHDISRSLEQVCSHTIVERIMAYFFSPELYEYIFVFLKKEEGLLPKSVR